MATEKWIAGSGAGLGWTSCFGAEINSVIDGNAVLAGGATVATNQIDNSASLDMFADVMFALGSWGAVSATALLSLYLYPLNQDGATYGDGRFTSAAAGPPAAQYFAGIGVLVPSVTQAQQGHFKRPDGTPIIIPPGKFKFVLYNKSGATLAASGNAIYYRTYNRQVA
jgi:hypothetical protein